MATLRRSFGLARDPSAAICTHNGDVLNGESFFTLSGDRWVQSGVINHYITLISDRQRAALQSGKFAGPRCHFFNTFFFAKLTERVPTALPGQATVPIRYSAVRRWTTKSNPLATADLILVPINVVGVHWSCIAIVLATRQIIYFDSLRGSKSQKVYHMKVVWSWLLHECADKGGGAVLRSEGGPTDGTKGSTAAGQQRGGSNACSGGRWTMSIAGGVPVQRDSTSCGVFMLAILELLSRGVPPPYAFNSQHSAAMRRGVATELLQQRVQPMGLPH